MAKVTDNNDSMDNVVGIESISDADLIQGILNAAKANETYLITIPRNGKTHVAFRIKPLTEGEFQACREKHTKYKAARQFGGIRLPEKTDNVAYRSALIIAATVEEDRKKLWNNPVLLDGLGVVRAVDVVDKVLYSGEKDRVIDRIQEISGYTDDEEGETVEETIKNE